jgi:hypothetical protein
METKTLGSAFYRITGRVDQYAYLYGWIRAEVRRVEAPAEERLRHIAEAMAEFDAAPRGKY